MIFQGVSNTRVLRVTMGQWHLKDRVMGGGVKSVGLREGIRGWIFRQHVINGNFTKNVIFINNGRNNLNGSIRKVTQTDGAYE